MQNNLTIDTREISALLFDLDGTIINNMTFHHLAWQELLAELGHTWTLDRVQAEIWGKNQDIFHRIFPGRYTVDEVAELALRKELRYIDCYRPHIRMIEGLEKLLDKAMRAGLRLAVATAAPTVCVDFVFEALSLSKYFSHVVHADLVKRSKPDPETFLTAAALVEVTPSRCLVFEDAPVGARAAHAAGMDSIILLTTHSQEEFADFSTVRGFVTDYADLEISA